MPYLEMNQLINLFGIKIYKACDGYYYIKVGRKPRRRLRRKNR